MVMADPDYDLDPAQARQAARQVLRERASAHPPRAAGAAGQLAIVQLGAAFAPARDRRRGRGDPPSSGLTPASSRSLYTDRWALEAVFKAVQRPRVVDAEHPWLLPRRARRRNPRTDPALALDGGRSAAKLGPTVRRTHCCGAGCCWPGPTGATRPAKTRTAS